MQSSQRRVKHSKVGAVRRVLRAPSCTCAVLECRVARDPRSGSAAPTTIGDPVRRLSHRLGVRVLGRRRRRRRRSFRAPTLATPTRGSARVTQQQSIHGTILDSSLFLYSAYNIVGVVAFLPSVVVCAAVVELQATGADLIRTSSTSK